MGSFLNALNRYQIGLISLLAIIIRLFWINQPMRWDESFSYNHFIDQPIAQLFYYMEPNNHVLYNILVKLNVLILGSEPWSLRLWAAIASVVSIPVFYEVSRGVYKIESPWIGALFIACAPFLVLYSTNARGYSTQFMMVLLALWFQKDFFTSKKAFYAIIVLSALLLFLLPTSLIFVFPLWMIILVKANKKQFVQVTTGVLFFILLTSVLYAPIIYISGIEKLIANRYISPLRFVDFFTGIPENINQAFSSLFREVSSGWLVIIFTGIALVLAVPRNKPLFKDSLLLILGAFIVILFKRVLPFDRVYMVMLPVFLLLLTFFYNIVMKFANARLRPALNALAGAYFVFIGVTANQIDYSDTGVFPEAKAVAKVIKEKNRGEAINAQPVQDEPLFYYLKRNGVYEKELRNSEIGEFAIIQDKKSIGYDELILINDSLVLGYMKY